MPHGLPPQYSKKDWLLNWYPFLSINGWHYTKSKGKKVRLEKILLYNQINESMKQKRPTNLKSSPLHSTEAGTIINKMCRVNIIQL